MDPNSIVWVIYRALKTNPIRPYRFRKDMDTWARMTANHVHEFLKLNNVEMKHGKPLDGHGGHLTSGPADQAGEGQYRKKIDGCSES